MYQKTLPKLIGIKHPILTLIAFLSFGYIFGQSNPISIENALPGNPATEWDIPANTPGDITIQGFSEDISVNKGGTVKFKIDINDAGDKNFSIKIYRLGFYNGMGARLIADLGNFTGINQNDCNFDNTTGLVECSNWSTTTSWNVPATSVSGYYIAKLTRSAAGGGGSSHIAFIVRDDASTSKIFMKSSDATWQAYNGFGGYSLYVGAGMAHNHANKVSYDRPFITRGGNGGGGSGEDWFMNSEYPMIRFLESNGFDVSYTTDVDIARTTPNPILNHKIFLSVGHDEYWSKPERDNVEAARAAGIHLAFFSGNEVYWKTRWENGNDAASTPFRTMVCYKEGTLATPQENACGGKCDPTNEWTGLWRDGCNYPGVTDACKPENALTGEISWVGTTHGIDVPAAYKGLRFWRNTPDVANLGTGATYSIPNGTLGYEWDYEQYQSSYPAGRVTMSSTSQDGHVHKLSLYKSGTAIIFGAGTVQWAWGLDQNHDLNEQGGGGPPDQNVQQATINLLADMGAQPVTIQSPLTPAVQSTDVTPPVSVITDPVNGANIPENITYTITGTTTDVGGIVAGVDVSVDGGATWQAATGTGNWSFSWAPTTTGTVTIKSRAYDDIGNLELPGGSEGSQNTVNVTVTSSTANQTIFTPSQGPETDEEKTNHDDEGALNLGVKFRAAVAGKIAGIRFYKATTDPANITVQLYTTDGSLVGQAATSTTATGWTSVLFAAPVEILANTTYIASYYSPTGFYAATDNYFTANVVNGNLTALADGTDGGNGVYDYGASPAMPGSTFASTNYWVDVLFSADSGPDITPPVVLFTSPSTNATAVTVNSFVSVTFNENIDPATVTGTNLQLVDGANTPVDATVNYNVNSRTATLVPLSPLDYSAAYSVTVKGGSTGIKDLAGNALATDYTWGFSTADPPAIPPDDGSGGPVLIISSAVNPFSRYLVEILRAQGYTAFKAVDITEVRSKPGMLANYDVILLGQFTVQAGDVSLLTNWTNAGGTLIAQRPSALLRPLMGITTFVGTTHDQYLLVNTAAGMPGVGIVNQSIQYHGPADLYAMQSGTTVLATLYQDANTNTIYPAITSNPVGVAGGKAIAFSYDLAKSVIFTRQGDPTQVGKDNDGQGTPYRSDDLFMPAWIDFNKIQIPQADEQQHLLTNIILLDNLHKKPLPHLWILPKDLKAAVIMTGDDHNQGRYGTSSGTAGRFNEYIALSTDNSAQGVLDWNWQTIRGTSYVYNDITIPNDSVKYYQDLGFEIGLHPTTNCTNFTPASLAADMSSQLAAIKAQLPLLNSPVTNRTHCMPWSDWSTHPKTEYSLGMRFDVNYYYWPASWVQNRPGMFTGSGMPMRFGDVDGTLIDVYQAPTQMPDESGLDITQNINTLLDNAINKGYYGTFVMNMHTDTALHIGSQEIIASAQQRHIPVITAKQMLNWLDTRNGTAFSNMTWLDNKLTFQLTTSAHNLSAMVPFNSATGTLLQVTENDLPISFTNQTIKGIPYGVFAASTNKYVAIYSSSPLPVKLMNFNVSKQDDDALLTWSTSQESNNKGFEVQRSTNQSDWTAISFVQGAGNSQTEKDYQYLDQNLTAGTYYYRLRQVDYDGNQDFSPIRQVTFDGQLVLALLQNQPNPVTSSTTIKMIIPRSGHVTLTLYDQTGRLLKQLVDENKAPGTYTIQVYKNSMSAGFYYYKMDALGQSIVKKMTVL